MADEQEHQDHNNGDHDPGYRSSGHEVTLPFRRSLDSRIMPAVGDTR